MAQGFPRQFQPGICPYTKVIPCSTVLSDITDCVKVKVMIWQTADGAGMQQMARAATLEDSSLKAMSCMTWVVTWQKRHYLVTATSSLQVHSAGMSQSPTSIAQRAALQVSKGDNTYCC